MKATLLHKNIPVKKINVSFLASAAHIETAIIGIWVLGEKATKGRIEKEIQSMFYCGGNDGSSDWVAEEYREQYQKKANEHAQKLFPTFYKEQS